MPSEQHLAEARQSITTQTIEVRAALYEAQQQRDRLTRTIGELEHTLTELGGANDLATHLGNLMTQEAMQKAVDDAKAADQEGEQSGAGPDNP